MLHSKIFTNISKCARPETYPELVSGLKKAMSESGIEVSGTDVENRTDTPVIEWLDENYKPHPSSGFRQSR